MALCNVFTLKKATLSVVHFLKLCSATLPYPALVFSDLLFIYSSLMCFAQHCQSAQRTGAAPLAENAPRRTSQDIGTPSFDDDHDDDYDDDDDDDDDDDYDDHDGAGKGL